MSQEVDYASVLADLEAKKSVLEAAIAGIKQMLGLGSVEFQHQQGQGGSSRPEFSGEVAPGTFHGLSITEAARKFLDLTKRKQKTRDICDALKAGGVESSAKSFYSNVFTALMRDRSFMKIGKHWALAEWYPNRVAPVVTGRKKKSRKRPPKKGTSAPGAQATQPTKESPAK